MSSVLVLTIIIFIGTYGLIISEKIHRSIVAMSGSLLILFLGILNFKEAKEYIDLNTIGLLIGMMIIVGVAKKTGIFEYLAVQAVRWAKGRPVKILLALSVITAAISALMDNVTTVLLIVPVTISITQSLRLNPFPFLISEVLASNIGGTATLIGDPPNIMIGSAVPHLSYLDFAVNLGPVCVVILVVTAWLISLIYRKELVFNAELSRSFMQQAPNEQIKDYSLMKKCLLVFSIVVIAFLLHQFLHWESSIIALAGAFLLLMIAREDPEEILLTIEWPTIFFFIGLFILVGALEKVGVIHALAVGALDLTGGNLVSTALLILWLSAIVSSFLDNIPFVATMIPLIKTLGELGGISNLDPLWWSLALGACLGGNGTLIGASVNVIVAGIAEKNGIPISFMRFTKVGFPLMIISIIIATIYVYLRYLI
ncbi:ArsB/NhaD family transporter [Bacillota bacterium LX-D]|nr:ArsB/NhaD family transporter [Bacillota bacterium LX-D]